MKNEKERKNIWTTNHPLIRKLKILLANAEKENKYDYDRVMKEIDFRVNRRERQRELLSASREREKKMQIKLQEMSEQRQSSLDKKRKKIFEREKKYQAYITEVNKEREKRRLYLSSSNALERLRKVRQQEQEFCDNTQKKINESLSSYTYLRADASKNYLKHIHELNNTDKVQAKKIELDKSQKENLEKKMSDKEINLAKFGIELKKEKKEKLKDYKENLFNKNKSAIERRGELLKSREDSLNKLMEKEKNKKISLNVSDRIKQFTDQLDNYGNLQKKNYHGVLKGIEERNDFLNKRHHEILLFDEENTKKNEKIAKKSQKEKLNFNQLLDQKYESFLTELRDINLQNIFNKKRSDRMKEYFQLKKEEKERLEKEKEEKEKAEGKY